MLSGDGGRERNSRVAPTRRSGHPKIWKISHPASGCLYSVPLVLPYKLAGGVPPKFYLWRNCARAPDGPGGPPPQRGPPPHCPPGIALRMDCANMNRPGPARLPQKGACGPASCKSGPEGTAPTTPRGPGGPATLALLREQARGKRAQKTSGTKRSWAPGRKYETLGTRPMAHACTL